ncbi:MAG: PfkB family carbohydrate kinase [Nanoarchaeota archaeon]|nr:PfkB family carbohydrate kinase [Nanoarchaeota archaeon]
MDKQEMLSILDNFAGKRIAVVGDVALDSFLYGVIDRINPEMPSAPLLKIDREEFALGCAANVALNLSKLGAKTKLFGVIGNDNFGKKFVDECLKNNVDFIPFFDGSTILKQRIKEKYHKGYVARADFGEFDLTAINKEMEEEILRKIFDSDFNAIILSDYNKKMFKGSLAQRIIEESRNKNVPVFVDPKPVNMLSFKKCHVLKHNEKEARTMVGLENSHKDIEEITKKIKEMLECNYVIITRGEKGMLGYDGNFHYITTKAREVEDVTGAGDTVMAAIALALVSGADLEKAAHIGNYAGGIVVEKSGTAYATIEEIKKRINDDK